MFVVLDETELRRMAAKVVYDLFTNRRMQLGDYLVIGSASNDTRESEHLFAHEVEQRVFETLTNHLTPRPAVKPMPIADIAKARRQLKRKAKRKAQR